MTDYVQVMTTTAAKQDAEKIARLLVDQRLAACVQVLGPMMSIYRWGAAIETAEEWQCLVKTRRDLYDQVEAAIRGVHPYEVPEILALSVLAGSRDYLDWLEGELQPRQ